MREEIPQEQPEENWLTALNSQPKDGKLSLHPTSRLMGIDKITGFGLRGGPSPDLETAAKVSTIGALLKFGENDISVLNPFIRSMSQGQRDQLATDIKEVIADVEPGTLIFSQRSLNCDYPLEILKERLGILLKFVETPTVDIDATAI